MSYTTALFHQDNTCFTGATNRSAQTQDIFFSVRPKTMSKTQCEKDAWSLPGLQSVTPRTWQSVALTTWCSLQGVFINAGVGAGKTLVGAALAGTGSRALVLLPAAALRQTEAMYRAYGAVDVTFCSYTKLQRAESAELLETLRPDVLILDEAHALRRVTSNSAAKRIDRYLVANPQVRVAVLTASMQSDTIMDWGHLANWALRQYSPVPRLRGAREALAERLQRDPAAREAFRERLENTPGMIGASLDAEYQGDVVLRVVRRDPALVLPDSWETPSGFLVESAAHAAEVERQLAWGYYHDVDPRPSEAYVEARRAWGAVVRRVVGQGLCDTEYQVRALRPEAYARWAEAQRAEGTPAEARAVWAQSPDLSSLSPRGLVWAHHQALQERVAYQLAAPLFREGARSADGAYLPDYRGALAVASIEACHQSLNLQHFSHNLVLEPPADPEVWKQLVGRTARQGQTAPRVTCDVVVNCPAAERALRSAIDRASLVYETTGKKNPLLQLKGKDW